ncbi:MAG: Mur ligase family protein, partial [Bacteroidales bacterium]
MKEFISIFKDKNILILGFGKEGISTYKAIRSFLPEIHISIADKNKRASELFSEQFNNDNNITFTSGENYLNNIDKFDIIIKSPGISFKELDSKCCNAKVTSQTELFIQLFKDKIIGITGTKGKSTTASLLLQIIKTSGKDAVLVGNIGIPPFDHLQKISDETTIVYEMSSHQLENIKVSPHISILLNIYQEHLDHYESYNAYKEAKFNICRWQTPDDYLIIDKNNEAIRNMPAEYFGKGQVILLNNNSDKTSCSFCMDDDIYFIFNSQKTIFKEACLRRQLRGKHNLVNIQSAAVASYLAGIPVDDILQTISVFEGLPHRL